MAESSYAVHVVIVNPVIATCVYKLCYGTIRSLQHIDLWWASRYGYPDRVSSVLETGVSVDITSPVRFTLLVLLL